MLISDGWFLRPVTMTLIYICGQAESGMDGLRYRKILGEITEFRFSGPTPEAPRTASAPALAIVHRSLIFLSR